MKSDEQQASAAVFRARDLLVRHRTQTINALRGHLAEYGHVVAQGPAHVARLLAQVEDPGTNLPKAACLAIAVLTDTLQSPNERIGQLDKEIARRAREDEDARRLLTIPRRGANHGDGAGGTGPERRRVRKGSRLRCLAGPDAIAAIDGRKVKAGRDVENGRTHPSPPFDHRSQRRGLPRGPSWRSGWNVAARMLARKPRMLVTVALANKMSRIVWALMTRGGHYETPVVAA